MFRARSFLSFHVCIFIAFWCRVHQCTLDRFSSSQIIQIIQIGREGGRVCLFPQVLLIRFLFNGIGRTGWTGHVSFRLTNRSKLQRIRMRPIFWLSAVLHRGSCTLPMHTSVTAYLLNHAHCSIYKTCYSSSFAFSTVLFRDCASECRDLASSSSPVITALLTSVFNRCSKSFCSASI